MAKGNNHKTANGSALDFEAQLWAAAQAVPAPNCTRRKRWPCASTTTWKLARMNLAIRGIDANLGPRNADSFRADLHPDLKADFILANPPFNMSDWGGENLRQDVRWKFGMPPVNNANYAWIQHFIHHLSPRAALINIMRIAERWHLN